MGDVRKGGWRVLHMRRRQVLSVKMHPIAHGTTRAVCRWRAHRNSVAKVWTRQRAVKLTIELTIELTIYPVDH